MDGVPPLPVSLMRCGQIALTVREDLKAGERQPERFAPLLARWEALAEQVEGADDTPEAHQYFAPELDALTGDFEEAIAGEAAE
jgi:hypothetical protein